MAFCRRFLDLPLAWIRLLHSPTLSLGCALRIEWPGLTVGAEMSDLSNVEYHSIGVVVAFNVLPSLASLTQHGVPIIFIEATDTFDRVILFIFRDWHCVLRHMSSLGKGRKRAVAVNLRRRERVGR